MRKIVLTYGLIAGAILSVLMLLTLPFIDRIGFDKGAIIGYTGMVMAFLMVYFGVRAYRDGPGGGKLGFGRAFGVGMLIVLVGSICYVATWEVVHRVLAPDFGEKWTAYEVEQVRKAGGTEEQVAAKQAEMTAFLASYANPFVSVGYTLLEPLPVGLPFALISAWLLRRKPA